MSEPTRRETLVEQLARAMRPGVFDDTPDDQVKPTVRYERGRVRRYAEQILDSGLVADAQLLPAPPDLTPREIFLRGRQAARSGQVLYDGDKFPISFDRTTQDRLQKLAAAWRVPRAEMVRYLVAAAIDPAEALPVPQETKEEPK